MHQRRINLRCAFGQTGIAGLGTFGHGHQIGHLVQRRMAPRRDHLQGQRAGQVHFARTDHAAGPGIGGQAFAGQQ